jgi:hypothetical protein
MNNRLIFVMISLIVVVSILLTVVSFFEKKNNKLEVSHMQANAPQHVQTVEITKLSNDFSSRGLFKLTVDDTISILIYRGVESVSIIQLK